MTDLDFYFDAFGYEFKPIFNEQTPRIEKITEPSEEITRLGLCILEFAKQHKNPELAGIAANQLSVNGHGRIMENLCCVRSSDGLWTIALNPIIIFKSEKVYQSEEGCLTWPNKKIVALRHEEVTVSYSDLEGTAKVIEVKDFEAAVWQHEIKHLQGESEYVISPKSNKIFGPSIENGGTIISEEKNKPNKPCLCGSGKKYKKCCGRI